MKIVNFYPLCPRGGGKLGYWRGGAKAFLWFEICGSRTFWGVEFCGDFSWVNWFLCREGRFLGYDLGCWTGITNWHHSRLPNTLTLKYPLALCSVRWKTKKWPPWITSEQSIKIIMEKTDQSLQHNRPNIIILEKGERNVPSLLLCVHLTEELYLTPYSYWKAVLCKNFREPQKL